MLKSQHGPFCIKHNLEVKGAQTVDNKNPPRALRNLRVLIRGWGWGWRAGGLKGWRAGGAGAGGNGGDGGDGGMEGMRGWRGWSWRVRGLEGWSWRKGWRAGAGGVGGGKKNTPQTRNCRPYFLGLASPTETL